jgi:hypothetical protein
MADRLPSVSQSFDDEPHSGYVPVREPSTVDRLWAYRDALPPGIMKGGASIGAALYDLGDSFIRPAYESAVRSYEEQRQLPRVDNEGRYAGTPKAEPLDAFTTAMIPATGAFGARAAGLTSDVGDLGMFAGRGAKTADHAKLAQAERMADEGASRDTIWKETGWFQGADGQWRYEIDDSSMRFRDFPEGLARNDKDWRGRNLKDEASGTVGSLVDHPALFEAYPDLAQVPMTMARGWGENVSFSSPKKIHVGGYETADMRGATLHELQHKVQDAEGFSPGSSSYMEGRPWNSPFDDHMNYERVRGEVEARNVQERYHNEPYKDAFPISQPNLPYIEKTYFKSGPRKGQAKTGENAHKGKRPKDYAPFYTEDRPRDMQSERTHPAVRILTDPKIMIPGLYSAYSLSDLLTSDSEDLPRISTRDE